jgi:predicted transcriptional regulator
LRENFLKNYNKEIDEAMERIDKGLFITHEDVEKEAEKW